jgi:drug/metabolite transporter (DMT)-like permease
MTERQKALIAVILCVLFWGFSFVSIKAAVSVFPPMTLGAFRFVLALIILLIIKRRSAPEEKPEAGDFPWLAGGGLAGVTLYFFFENNGVALVTVSEAAVIVSFIPVLTMAAEWFTARLRRRAVSAITGRRWLGAALSLAGVALVVGAPMSGNSGGAFPVFSKNALGYLCMFGAALSWVVYCFLTKRLVPRRSRICIVLWQNFFGFLGFLPFAALEFPRWGRPSGEIWIHVLFLSVCCSALGYMFYARSLEVLGVSVSSIFINLIPVVTVVAGFFLLGDRLGFVQWIGAALVILGVSLAMWEGKPRTAP